MVILKSEIKPAKTAALINNSHFGDLREIVTANENQVN